MTHKFKGISRVCQISKMTNKFKQRSIPSLSKSKKTNKFKCISRVCQTRRWQTCLKVFPESVNLGDNKVHVGGGTGGVADDDAEEVDEALARERVEADHHGPLFHHARLDGGGNLGL